MLCCLLQKIFCDSQLMPVKIKFSVIVNGTWVCAQVNLVCSKVPTSTPPWCPGSHQEQRGESSHLSKALDELCPRAGTETSPAHHTQVPLQKSKSFFFYIKALGIVLRPALMVMWKSQVTPLHFFCFSLGSNSTGQMSQ